MISCSPGWGTPAVFGPSRSENVRRRRWLAGSLQAVRYSRRDAMVLACLLVTATCLIAAGAGATATSPTGAVVVPVAVHRVRQLRDCFPEVQPPGISEEEGKAIITSELAAGGIEVGPTVRPLGGLRAYLAPHEYGQQFWPRDGAPGGPLLVADLASQDGSFLVEFVSAADAFALGGHSATTLAARLAECGTSATFAVFFDPSGCVTDRDLAPSGSGDETSETRWTRASIRSRVEAERLLRYQVRDVLDWLHARQAE